MVEKYYNMSCCLKILSIFTIPLITFSSNTFANGLKLDLSWSGLNQDRFFNGPNRTVPSRMQEATEINLRGNFFERFSDCSGRLDKLESLDLSQNLLKAFYFACNHKDTLLKLNVSCNELTTLNQTLTHRMTKLKVLDLSHNLMDIVDQELFQHLQNLQYLRLDGNQIGDNIHEDAFKKLKSLSELYLGQISASNFSDDLFAPLINLKRLSLSFNPIETIPVLPKGLESLDISGTNIIMLKNLDLPNLVSLAINYMPRLESLDLNDIEKLVKLKYLSIENSPVFKYLTALPTRDDLLPGLKQISVKNCSIDKLGEDLAPIIQRISQIDLQYNPWQCDCDIKWIFSVRYRINYHDHFRCRSPPELRGQRVFEIPVDQFYCSRINYWALGLAMGIIAAGIVAGVIYYKGISFDVGKPISRRWHSICTNHRCNHDGDTISYKNMKSKSNETEKILDQSDITDYP